jgi:hypothetical protein
MILHTHVDIVYIHIYVHTHTKSPPHTQISHTAGNGEHAPKTVDIEHVKETYGIEHFVTGFPQSRALLMCLSSHAPKAVTALDSSHALKAVTAFDTKAVIAFEFLLVTETYTNL